MGLAPVQSGQERQGGIEGALLQEGPKVGDPLLDLPQPGRGLRVQARALWSALRSGALPHTHQPRALPLQLGYQLLDPSPTARHALILPGRSLLPKRDLASAPLVLMQNKQLKIAEGLQLADTLKRELLNFKVKINISTAHDSYEAWREGDHDDLVLAVAMACWCGERYLRKETSRPRPGIVASEGVPMNVIGRLS